MRFGFKVPLQGTTWSAFSDVWHAGDDLDIFESAWTYDHLVTVQAVDGRLELAPEKPMLDGWSLLAALAARTRRLRVGNLVTCVPFRHPVVLAKMATTIDEISGGRLELGLGAGWLEPEAAMFGTDLGTVRERLDRLEETLQVLLGLFENESFDHDGKFFHLSGARIEPKVQRPRPPIWLGGNGEKRTLRLVAQYADAWNYTALRPGGELDLFRSKCHVLAGHCATVGRDPAEVLVTAQLAMSEGPSALADMASAWHDAGAQYVIVFLPEGSTAATLEELAAALEPLRSS
jgi:F420-dependent oxidoreductase-like protein